MLEKIIKGRMCHEIYQDVKANNKHLNNYDTNKGSLCLMYWDMNNLNVLAMSEKLPVNGFK